MLLPWAYGQDKNPVSTAEKFRQWSEEYEREGLATPFKGVTTNGEVVPGLFEINPTGVSTESVRNADRKSTRLNSSHLKLSRMPSSA